MASQLSTIASPIGLASNLGTSSFEDGLEIFKQELTADPKKRKRLETLKATNLADVLNEVRKAEEKYRANHRDSKTQKCIGSFSKRIHYYGKVMDVVVQHHPEYASLAWGAMKVVFGAIIEHENLGVTIVSALCDVADAISRVQLVESLYRTPEIKQAIATLYSYIIKFLMRAWDWYETNSVTRALHSVFRPVDLRYKDLLQDIEKSSRKVSELSQAISQAEIRAVHQKVEKGNEMQLATRNGVLDQSQQMKDMQIQMQGMMALIQQYHQYQMLSEQRWTAQFQDIFLLNQNIRNVQVDIYHRLSGLQLTQALDQNTSPPAIAFIIDYQSSYDSAIIIRKNRRFTSHAKSTPFWTSPRLINWDQSPASSQLMVKAVFSERQNIRDFSTNVIEQLLQSKISVFWILKSGDSLHSMFDVLQSLIHQALHQDNMSHVDVVFSTLLRRLEEAQIVDDQISLLGEVLSHFELVYMVIDTDAVHAECATECCQYLRNVSRILEDRNAQTVLKIMFLDYRPSGDLAGWGAENILRIGKVALRKNKRLPSLPLRDRPGLSSGRLAYRTRAR